MKVQEFVIRHRIEIVLFLAALVARLFLFGVNLHAEHWNLINTIHGDDGYFELSRNVAAGHGFTGETEPPYHENTLRTPGYIYFLAVILWATGSYWLAVILQMILGAFIPVLSRKIAILLTGSERIGLLTGVLLSFEPYLVLFSSIFYTETFFIFLFLIFLILFHSYLSSGSWKVLVCSAVVLGLATLSKTTPQYLPVLLLPVMWWRFKREFGNGKIFFHMTAFLVVFLIVLSPWLYRNYRDFGKIGMSAQPSYNLYVYFVPSVLSLERGTPFISEFRNFSTPEESSGLKINISNGGEYTRKALTVLSGHPKGVIISSVYTFVTFFTHDGMLTVLEHMGYISVAHLSAPALSLLISSPVEFLTYAVSVLKSPLASVFVMRIVWVAITILFFCGISVYLRRNGLSYAIVFSLVIVLYFMATSILGGLGANARYRMPVNPIIITFAIYGASGLYLIAKSQSDREKKL